MVDLQLASPIVTVPRTNWQHYCADTTAVAFSKAQTSSGCADHD